MPTSCISENPEPYKNQRACIAKNALSDVTAAEDLSGPQIALKFVQEASSKLSRQEFAELLKFLKSSKAGTKETKELLHARVTQRLEDFYTKETSISGETRERLTGPGGPEDANLGLILHLQTKKIVYDSFWDPESPTIALLNQKGITDEFAYGYELALAWRGNMEWKNHVSYVEMEQRPQNASRRMFGPSIGDSCARDGLRKYLSQQVKSLDIALSPPLGILRFDLDFRPSGLRRIILYLRQPAAGFIATAASKQAMAAQIDAGCNFFLWLTGRKYETNTFRREYSQSLSNNFSKRAPLAEMYSYRKKETEEGKYLRAEDYTPAFRSWAINCLSQDPASIISAGKSLANELIRKIGAKISITRKNPRQQKTIYCSRINGPSSTKLRTKLLPGGTFNCKQGKVTFRDVVFFSSKLTNVVTVFLHVELVAEGLEHPNPCAEDSQNDDPARRLGVKMRYVQNEERIEIWMRLSSDLKAKRLNSLVDFLGSKDSKVE